MAQPTSQTGTGAVDLPGLAVGDLDGVYGLGLPRELVDDCERRVRVEVARELHDRVAQPLSTLVTELELLRQDGGDRRQARRRIDGVQDQVRTALFGLREVLCELREQEWMESGLVGRVRGELETVVLRHPSLDVRLRVSARWPAAIRSRVADHLLQVVREAVHNARLHGGATLIEVALGVNGRRAEVVVGDDGRGLDGPVRPGMGLLGIHERATLLGGRLVVGDRPGGGTRLRVSVPREVLG
jgi:two-component system, NarL family, sensor histidine kinase UhpB